MNEYNQELMDKVLQQKLEKALEEPENIEAFKDAMTAVDKSTEVCKTVEAAKKRRTVFGRLQSTLEKLCWLVWLYLLALRFLRWQTVRRLLKKSMTSRRTTLILEHLVEVLADFLSGESDEGWRNLALFSFSQKIRCLI